MPVDDATLWELCRDKEFRHRLAFLALGRGLARQIRGMRRSRGWSQKELADRLGTTQPRVALLEQWCGNVSIKTLQRIACVFDVALEIRFVSWGELFLILGRHASVPMSYEEEFAMSQAADAVDPVATNQHEPTTRD